ncbi:MAG: PfkB family carbohydrate kinase [Promethearchaeota archaeon]
MHEPLNQFDVTIEARERVLSKFYFLKENLKKKTFFLGLDGYVDSLYSLVLKRTSISDWKKIDSMKNFGQRLVDVAGSSTNVERVLKRKTSGGFAPNTCKAINNLGFKVNLIAAAGYPSINQYFKYFEENKEINLISIENPGSTIGLEFNDGKVMITDFKNIYNINWNLLLQRVGLEKLTSKISESNCLGFGHWALVYSMNEIWIKLMENIFPTISHLKNKLFFVDLADIKKRTNDDILEMVKILKTIQEEIPVLLSLNDQEAIDLSKIIISGYHNKHLKNEITTFFDIGKKLNEYLDFSYLVIHAPHFATITTQTNHYWVSEAFTSQAKFTTGAGDHFHSGVAASLSCGFKPEEAILIGNALTAIFVRTGKSPNIPQLLKFIQEYLNYLEKDNPCFTF